MLTTPICQAEITPFRVIASNNDGIWNETGVSIPIQVTPPIWQMLWFQLTALAALAALVIGGIEWRIREVQNKRDELEARVQERTLELHQEIEQRQKAEQALAIKAAEEAVMTERTRLARDLHDAVTQTLFSASLIAEVLPDIMDMNQAEGLKRLEELRQLTRGALAEMRTLLVELRPNALVEIPLPDLLRQLCESLIGRARLPIQFTVNGQRKLPPHVQVALYRITQEALNNVVKHAKASQAVVRLEYNGTVNLSISDNGCGFDPAKVPPNHLGVQIMRERAESIAAEITVTSVPGEGTCVCIQWEDQGKPKEIEP